MSHPLDGCKAKVERANEHAAQLLAAHDEYLATGPYVAHARFDLTETEIVYEGTVRREPPLRIGVILGDLVHNLRSALDHLVWQLVLDNDEKPNRRNAFPVCTDPAAWAEARDEKLGRVHDSHAEMIEAEQPFTDSKPLAHPLARLNRLWNRDKHQVVVLMLSTTRDPSGIPFVARPLDLEKFRPVRDIARVISAEGYHGTPIHAHQLARLKIVPSGPRPHAEMLSQWVVGLSFEDGEPFDDAINAMGTTVERIINTFGPLLRSSSER